MVEPKGSFWPTYSKSQDTCHPPSLSGSLVRTAGWVHLPSSSTASLVSCTQHNTAPYLGKTAADTKLLRPKVLAVTCRGLLIRKRCSSGREIEPEEGHEISLGATTDFPRHPLLTLVSNKPCLTFYGNWGHHKVLSGSDLYMQLCKFLQSSQVWPDSPLCAVFQGSCQECGRALSSELAHQGDYPRCAEYCPKG